jgi:hypothetical protein
MSSEPTEKTTDLMKHLEKFCSENSPIIALTAASGDYQFTLPEYTPEYTHEDVLDMILGRKSGFKIHMLTYSIKQWLNKINNYLDTPLLSLFAQEFNMESLKWWKKFVACPGYQNFLDKYDYSVNNYKIVQHFIHSNNNIKLFKWFVDNCKKNNNKHFSSYIHDSCKSGKFEYAKICILNKVKDTNLYYGIDASIMFNHYKIFELLIENGADLDKALDASMWYGRPEYIKLCIDKGVKFKGSFKSFSILTRGKEHNIFANRQSNQEELNQRYGECRLLVAEQSALT